MANGIIADRNRVLTAVVDESGWSTAAPASNAQVLPLKLTARSTVAGTDGSPTVLRGYFDARYPITYAGLFKTNLKQSGRYRLRLFSDAAFSDVLFDTRDAVTGVDRRVMPSLYDWRQLRYAAPNLLRGDLPPEDYALYPSNVHVVVPLVRAASFQWDIVGSGFDPATGDDVDFNEVGYAWASDSVQFEINYAYGGNDGWNPTDEIKRTPGGGVYVEPGVGYRSSEIPLDYITKLDGDSLFDLSKRVSWNQPVVWLPNVDSAQDLFRYGFIGQRRDSFKKTWKTYQLDGATIQIEEITT
ncbi:hypothetical protein [Azospirillum sp.]|uniref:hypothetical protein n=1 Tax=Azospirillum sp. TaxID=34012 RepID=UPI003D703099